jgi:hypothetical protein
MTAPEGGWRHNIGGFERHYRPLGWLTRGSSTGRGFVAVKLDKDRRRVKGSPVLRADSLDELAALIDETDRGNRP